MDEKTCVLNAKSSILQKAIKLFAIITVIYILVLSITYLLETVGQMRAMIKIATTVLLTTAFAIMLKTGLWQRFASKRFALAAVIVGGILCRLLSIYLFRNVMPSSDFKTYITTALGFLSGNPNDAYISIYPHVAGYPLFLAGAFRLTGLGIGAVWLLNIAVECGIMLLLYKIAVMTTKDKNPARGLIASTLYAFLPSSILYTVIPCSELSFGFFILLTIYLFALACRDSNARKRVLALYIFAGIALAVANMIRPFGVILLIATTLVVLLYPIRHKVFFLVMPVVYFIFAFIISTSISTAIQRPVSTLPVGWNLYDGLSVQGNGMWNATDAKLAAEQFGKVEKGEITADDYHRFFLGKSRERIVTQGWDTLTLLYSKPLYMWRADSQSFSSINSMLSTVNAEIRSTTKIEIVYGIINGYYVFLLILAIWTLIRLWKQNDMIYLLFTVLFCGLFAVHLILEASERYHFLGIVAFIFIMSGSVKTQSTSKMEEIREE